MKKIFYGIFICLMLAGVDRYFIEEVSEQSSEIAKKRAEVFETFEKKDGKISKRKSNEPEVKRLERTTDRKTSSIKTIKKAEVARRGDRILIGQTDPHFQDINRPMEILNSYNKNWKELLSKELLHFLPDGSKAMIKRNQGFVKIANNRGVLLEKAMVSIKLPNGTSSSYNALVDSSNGRIIHTWNSSKLEGISYPLKIYPRGTINSPSFPRN